MFRSITSAYCSYAMTVATGVAIACSINNQPKHDHYPHDNHPPQDIPQMETPTGIMHGHIMKIAVSSLLTGAVWPLSLYDIYHSRYPLKPFRLLPSPWDEQASDAYLGYLRQT